MKSLIALCIAVVSVGALAACDTWPVGVGEDRSPTGPVKEEPGEEEFDDPNENEDEDGLTARKVDGRP